MTTYLYRDGADEVLRTNRFANPSFETDTDGVTASSGDFAAYTSLVYDPDSPYRLSGVASLVWATSETPSANTSLSQAVDGTVSEGQWVAVCMPVRLYQWTGRVQALIAPDTFAAPGEGTIIAAPSETWAYPVATFQVPPDATSCQAFLNIYGETDDAPPASEEGDTDAWIATVGDTEAEALDALEPYFDGDTPTSDLNSYAWTGTPHASTSTESAPYTVLSPMVILNYQHETATGVLVHDTLAGGRPLIARRERRGLPTGTFEVLCPTIEDAAAVAELCNGATDVVLVSDDVPGAPFTFTPRDGVVVRKNEPYSSFTVNVPYVRTS